MSRPVFALSALLLGLSACGGLGLAPVTEGDDELAMTLDQESEAGQAGADTVDVSLSGRTYSTMLSDLTVVQPAGLDALLGQVADGELLFHVVDEDSDRLDIVMAAAGADGGQDPCEPVYALPRADWSENPEFFIEDGETEIAVGGQPLGLDHLDLEATVSAAGDVWKDTVITAVFDTRDLLGGALPEGTNVCHLIEELGGDCLACEDGEAACTTLQLQLEAVEVEVDFDPDHSPAGGC